jgi:hypothetical protein
MATWRVQIGITFPDMSDIIKGKRIKAKVGAFGRWRLEVGGKRGENWEFGLRPLRALGFPSREPGRSPLPLLDGVDPEAIGACAPEGKRKIKAKSIVQRAERKAKAFRRGSIGFSLFIALKT